MRDVRAILSNLIFIDHVKTGADRQLNMGGKDITNNCIYSRSPLSTNHTDRSFLIYIYVRICHQNEQRLRD